MDKQENSKEKRTRRTKKEIDGNIDVAMKKMVEKKGFINLTLSAIAQQAKIDPPVIYNKYKNLNSLLEGFTKGYDHWLNAIIDKQVENFHAGKHEAFLSGLFREMAQELYNDRIMQQLLVWEVAENNNITERSAKIRESNVYLFSGFYDMYFKGADVDFNVYTSILIAGIYYLVLHKDVSTFCSVDFSTEEGKERLLKTIKKLCAMLFSEQQPDKQRLEIAWKLKEKGVDINIIAECTGLTLDRISN
jgi:AcrR family transcriptional regulator